MILPDGYSEIGPGKLATVVTSLEMLSRPPPRPESARAGWRLRRVERPDPDWYRDLYRRIGEDWLWFSRLALPRDRLAAILDDPRVEVCALSPERGPDRAEGLAELDFRTEGVAELAFFGVTAALIGTGAGRWLMNRTIERAWSRPIRRLWVHTCTFDHPAALAFYMRSGFRPFRRQVEVVDDPRLSGLLPPSAAPQMPMIPTR